MMDTEFDIGSSRKSLNDIIVIKLREAILRGDFKPGDRLTEPKLAELFNVSRNPIREALKVLHTEGLVEINPRKGAKVPQVSIEEIEEMVELRSELEAMSVRLAVRRLNDSTKEAIKKLLEAGEEAKSNHDLKKLSALNDEYHQLLADAGNNRYLADFMRTLRERTLWIFSNAIENHDLLSWQEHTHILKAILVGHSNEAAILASEHVRRSGRSSIEKLSQSSTIN